MTPAPRDPAGPGTPPRPRGLPAAALGAVLGLLAAGLLGGCDQAPPPPPDAAQAAPPAPASPRPHSPPRFRTRSQLALDGKPEHVLGADLDGDGRAELLATTRDPGTLHLWRAAADAPGGALAAEPSTHPIGAWPLGPVALPAGSFGAPSGVSFVAIASRADRTIVVHDLLGETPPREVWRGATAVDVPRAMAAGDLGADGTVELGVATDRHELFIIGPSGTTVRELAGELPRCLLFLGDGAGIVVGCQDTQTLEVHGPDATAGRLATLELDGIPRALVEADIDFDGEPELVAVGGDHALWSFGRGRSGGSAAWLDSTDPAARVAYGWDTYAVPIDLEAPDFRGDGRSELCILHAYDLSYMISGGWGDGRPEEFARGYAGQTPTNCSLADFDGDGRLDLAITNRDARAISILLGDGRGHLRDATHVRVGTAPSFVLAADLLGSELPEVVTINSKSETLTVLANNDGTLTLAQELLEIGPSPRAPIAAQLDGAGPLELAYLTTDTTGAHLVLLAADEHGQFAPVREPLLIGTSGSDLLALDLDGDGRAELICADADAGEVIVVTWAAGDPWSTAEPLRLPVPSAPVALAQLQFDDDPAPELAVALGSPGPRLGVALLDVSFNAQGALVLLEIGFLPTELWPIDLVEADLDGAGRTDLGLLGLTSSGSAEGRLQLLLRATETSTFEPGAKLVTGLRPHHIAAADLDADGRSDLVVNAQNSHVVNAWVTRSGSALGALALPDQGAHLGPLDVAVADIDGDGIEDLVVANSFSNDVSVLLGVPR